MPNDNATITTDLDTPTWRATIDEIDPEHMLRILDQKRALRLATYKHAQSERTKRDKQLGDKLSAGLRAKAEQVERFFAQLDKKIEQTQKKIIEMVEDRRRLIDLTTLVEELNAEADGTNDHAGTEDVSVSEV